MNEEEKKAIVIAKEDIKTTEKQIYDGSLFMIEEAEKDRIDILKTLLNLIEKQQKEMEQEKGKNKKLEEEYAKAIESEADIAVGSHKLINIKDKVIDLMAEELSSLKAAYDFNCFIPDKYSNIDDCINKADKNISC